MLSSRKEFSGSQGRTLHFLLAQTDDIFQKDIKEEYSIRPSTATELLKQIEKNELIARELVAYDNRLKKIVVTDKALLYKQQVIEDLTTLEETLVKGISEMDLQIFFNIILKYSIPPAISLLITAIYNIVDRIFVGNFNGTSTLAGLSICFPLSYMMMAFGLMYSAGVASLFSLFLVVALPVRLGQIVSALFGTCLVLKGYTKA